MQKRGQVTIFVIIGLVALITIVLVFFAKDLIIEQTTKATDNEKYLQLQATSIQNQLRECTQTKTQETLNTLAEQGGYFDPTNFISYYNKKIGYRCTKRENGCINDPIIKESFTQKVADHLTTEIETCVDITPFRNKDFTLQTGELTTELTLNQDNTQVTVTYPLTLTRNEVTITRDTTMVQVDVPLDTVIDATNKILNVEATNQEVDPLVLSLESAGKYAVEVEKPYPHKIYTITADSYVWQFAVEGEGRYASAY